MKAEDGNAPYGWANEHNRYFEHLEPFKYDDFIHARSIRLVKLDCKRPQKRKASNYIRDLALRRRSTPAKSARSTLDVDEDPNFSLPLSRSPMKTGLWRQLKDSGLSSGSDDTVMVAARTSYRIGKSDDVPFSPLEVSMQEFSWDHLPPFEAMSYVWGARDMRAIICNGCTMMVSRNCAMALYNLSYDYNEAMTRWIWIDQISINQSNLTEKGAQVNMMGEIYSIATRTVAWLGESNVQNQRCFQRFDDIRHKSRRHKYIENYVTQYTDEEVDITACATGEWFRRGWITQEAGLFRRLDFLCGDWVYPWDALYEVYRALRHQKVMKVPLMNDIERLSEVRLKILSHGDTLSLSEAIHCSMSTVTSQPLDRLYALYGLCDTLRDVLGKPDYDKTLADLVTELTCGILKAWGQQSIVFWGLVASFGGDRSSSGFPSWLPDLTLPLSSVKSACRPVPYRVAHGADLDRCGARIGSEILSDDLRRLTCKGVRIDSLSRQLWNSASEFSKALCPDGDWPEEIEAFHAARQSHSDAEKYYKSIVHYYNGAEMLSKEHYGHDPYLGSFLAFLELPSSTTGYQYNESTFNGTAPWSTENNHFVLVPQQACERDTIVYVKGSLCLFLLRPKDDVWEVVGACRLYGLTNFGFDKLEERASRDEFILV